VTRFMMSNSAKIALVASVLLVFAPRAGHALDRYGLMGLGVRTPLVLEPSVDAGDVTYSVDMAYFFHERWAALLAWDIGLEGQKWDGLAVGLRTYMGLDWVLRPYATLQFVYLLNPKNDLGWRVGFGAEWNLRAATKIDNLSVFFDTGLSQVFADNAPDWLILDLFRSGLSWSY
jgi:hypothetical protein